MDMLQKAIEEITYFSDIFPEEEFQVITANKEEAVPYLREAVEYVLRNRTELEENYQLYFYAIYLLAEFGDRESFPRIVPASRFPIETFPGRLRYCRCKRRRNKGQPVPASGHTH